MRCLLEVTQAGPKPCADSELGYIFSHRIAVGNDSDAALAFRRSHGFEACVGPRAFVWGSDPIPSRHFVEGDMMLHGWKHLFSNEAFDLLMMSPPCLAWSFASLQQGLLRLDGRLTLHAWGTANIMKPRIVLMEMVSEMKDHCHWKIVREFILWCAYSIHFCRNIKLSELTPQHRDRLILIATLGTADLFPHLPACWPPTQGQTLESYMNLMDLLETWLSQCALSDDLLKVYLDPQLLPKSLDQRGKGVKRQRRDAEQYRIKHPRRIFGCIMPNYSYGHLLPEVSLQHSGLFGTLIALPTGLRFMSIPEILI